MGQWESCSLHVANVLLMEDSVKYPRWLALNVAQPRLVMVSVLLSLLHLKILVEWKVEGLRSCVCHKVACFHELNHLILAKLNQ